MKTDFYSMNKAELEAWFLEAGEPKFRAKQFFTWLHTGTPVSDMTNLSKKLRAKIEDEMLDTLPKVELKLTSKLYDGECIESVLMQYKHGNTLCISSQVGCRMGCAFCASTLGGRVRNLLPSELLGQIIAAERDSGLRVSNVVMMGIGEPLDNFDNVVKFLKLLGDEDGLNIGYRHISLSTCGIVPKIIELGEYKFPITLSISLHASSDERRSEIMPINKKWNIDALLSACAEYYKKTGRRISFEYTLIEGKNDSEEDAISLAKLLRGAFKSIDAPIHVNLIRVNEVKETGFREGSRESIEKFAKILESRGIVATLRRRLGSDVNAACGQLRRATKNKTKEDEA